jgi:hypothetical protein
MLEHYREEMEHAQQHADAAAEHEAYHRLYDPSDRYDGYGITYQRAPVYQYPNPYYYNR